MADDDLKAIESAISSRLKSHSRALKIAKGIFIVFGAAVAGIAQFAEFGPTGPSHWQVAGIIATICVFSGGLYVAFTDDDAPQALERARQAIRNADDLRLEYHQVISEFGAYEKDADRARELYLSMHAMRSALERVKLAKQNVDLGTVLLDAAHQHLPVALGFQTGNHWTLCIFEAVLQGSSKELVLKAHRRAIECPIDAARKWPIGSGFMGAAYANKREVLVDDTRLPSIRSIYSLPIGLKRDYDDLRLRFLRCSPHLGG